MQQFLRFLSGFGRGNSEPVEPHNVPKVEAENSLENLLGERVPNLAKDAEER